MARARKAADIRDSGLGWLFLGPFQAFSPLNLAAWAAPSHALPATIEQAQLMLAAWRANTDCLRALIRLHQDETLRLMQAPLYLEDQAQAAAAEPAPAETREEDAPAAAATLLMQPMLEATRAYGRVGRAFIVAQRDTMRAFAPPKPH